MPFKGKITNAAGKIVGSFRADKTSITIAMKESELQSTLDKALKQEWSADVQPSEPISDTETEGGTSIVQWKRAEVPSNQEKLKFFYAMLNSHNLYEKDVEVEGL